MTTARRGGPGLVGGSVIGLITGTTLGLSRVEALPAVALAALWVIVLACLLPIAAGLVRRREFLVSALAVSVVLTGWQFETGFITLTPWHFVIFACFGYWFVDGSTPASGRRGLDAVGVFALLVVAGAWLSYFGAIDTMMWLKRAMKVTWLFGMFLFLVRYAGDQRQLAALIRASLWSCAVASIAIMAQVLNIFRRDGFGEYFAAPGTFANSNEAATYLVIFVIMALALYRSRVNGEVMGTRALLTASAVCVAGILLTRSRTALAALTIVTIVLFFHVARVRRLILVLAIVLAIVGWNVPATGLFASRILATFGLSGNQDYDDYIASSASERLFLVERYWAAVKARPVFGIGAGNYEFLDTIGLDLPPPPPEAGLTTEEAYVGHSSHNGFINWWAETGTVGFVPFVGSLLCAGFIALRLVLAKRLDVWWRAVATGALGGVIVFIATNLTGEFGVPEARYWLVLALVSIALSHAVRLRPIRRPVLAA